MTRARLGALTLILMPLTGGPCAWAQATATTGEIEGIVADESGAALPAVTIIARNVRTGFVRTVESGRTGTYRLSLLPLGRYELSAWAAGFATLKQGGLDLSGGQTLSLRLTLKIAAVAESVDVTAEAPAVNSTRSLLANTIDERSIESLPSNGRRFQDLVLLTPGTVAVGPGAVVSSLGLISISGQRGLNTTYAVDGADYGEPQLGGMRGGDRSAVIYTLSQEALQEIYVTNAGYSAEFGRSGGGVVNAITRSGTNELQGSAFWFFRDEALTADDPFGRPAAPVRSDARRADQEGQDSLLPRLRPAAPPEPVRRQVRQRPQGHSRLRRPGRDVYANQRHRHRTRPLRRLVEPAPSAFGPVQLQPRPGGEWLEQQPHRRNRGRQLARAGYDEHRGGGAEQRALLDPAQCPAVPVEP